MKIYGYWKRGGKGDFVHTAQTGILSYKDGGIEKSADRSRVRGSAFLWYRKYKNIRYHCENCFGLLPKAIFLFLRNNKGGNKMGRLNKRGQSTLEYVIVLTAIVTAIIIAAATIKTKVQTSFKGVGKKVGDDIGQIAPAGDITIPAGSIEPGSLDLTQDLVITENDDGTYNISNPTP